MTAKVFALDTMPGVQRDGTVFDKQFYNDGRWVRFQRGRPRKMGGYRVISDQLTGPSRGIWVNAQNAFNYIFSGYNNGLQVLTIDDNGIGAGVSNFTLSNFTASNLNLWQFDGFYDVAGAGVQSLLAHPGQNLASIDNDANTPVLIGDINGTNMSDWHVYGHHYLYWHCRGDNCGLKPIDWSWPNRYGNQHPSQHYCTFGLYHHRDFVQRGLCWSGCGHLQQQH